VRYVLEGSVRRAGNRLRITAQLVEAATGTHVWAERYHLLGDFVLEHEDVGKLAVASPPPMAKPIACSPGYCCVGRNSRGK